MSSQASQRHKIVMTAAVNRHFIMMVKLSHSLAHKHTHRVWGTNPCTGLGICANVSLHSSSSLSQSISPLWRPEAYATEEFFTFSSLHFSFSRQLLTLTVFICSFLLFFLFVTLQLNHWFFQIKTSAFCHLQPNSTFTTEQVSVNVAIFCCPRLK